MLYQCLLTRNTHCFPPYMCLLFLAHHPLLSVCRLLREYIELEFTSSLADKRMTYPLDIERVIDDIILFCMLVGNDFLPGMTFGQPA